MSVENNPNVRIPNPVQTPAVDRTSARSVPQQRPQAPTPQTVDRDAASNVVAFRGRGVGGSGLFGSVSPYGSQVRTVVAGTRDLSDAQLTGVAECDQRPALMRSIDVLMS